MTVAAIDVFTAYTVETRVTFVLWVILLIVKVLALCDAVIRKDALYVAADKQNKAFWIILLAVFLALHVVASSMFLNLIGSVAAFVYLLDVRPTLRSMRHY